MAITFQTAGNISNGTSTGTSTTSINVGTSGNVFLMVVVGYSNNVAATNTAVSYGGQAMTQLTEHLHTDPGGGGSVKTWGLYTTLTGANNALVTTANATGGQSIAWIVFNNAGNIVTSSKTGLNSTTTISNTLTPTNAALDTMLSFGRGASSGTLTGSTGIDTTNNQALGSFGYKIGGLSNPHTQTFTGSSQGMQMHSVIFNDAVDVVKNNALAFGGGA